MRATRWVFAALLLMTAAACGGSSPKAANGPSGPAKMVCAKEAQEELQAALGVRPTAPVRGVWDAPEYSCRYRYGTGSFEVSVRDFPSTKAMTSYFNRYVARHTRVSSPNIGADQAAQVKNGSVVARRKLHVLVVDATDLPATFGSPPQSRAKTALTIGVVLMGCWTGAT